MAISLRKFRALVLEYHDAGSEGEVDSTYLVKMPTDGGLMWWCSFNETSGREVTTGMQPDHRVSAVFCFSKECPIAFDDAILCDGRSYRVTSAMPRQYGTDEIQVDADRVTELELTS